MKTCTPASLALCILSFVTHLSTTFAHFLMACYSFPYSLFSNVLLGNNFKLTKIYKNHSASIYLSLCFHTSHNPRTMTKTRKLYWYNIILMLFKFYQSSHSSPSTTLVTSRKDSNLLPEGNQGRIGGNLSLLSVGSLVPESDALWLQGASP